MRWMQWHRAEFICFFMTISEASLLAYGVRWSPHSTMQNSNLTKTRIMIAAVGVYEIAHMRNEGNPPQTKYYMRHRICWIFSLTRINIQFIWTLAYACANAWPLDAFHSILLMFIWLTFLNYILYIFVSDEVDGFFFLHFNWCPVCV